MDEVLQQAVEEQELRWAAAESNNKLLDRGNMRNVASTASSHTRFPAVYKNWDLAGGNQVLKKRCEWLLVQNVRPRETGEGMRIERN